MENQTIFKKYLFVIIFLALLAIPAVSFAADPPWKLVPTCGDGGCNVCDAIGVGINITKIMLGLLGSAALLMFIYGGFLMFTSRGHSDQVQKGKDALINAVKGVIIVLASWMVINYGLAVIVGVDDFTKVSLFKSEQPWWYVQCVGSAQTECELKKGNLLYQCIPLKDCRDYNSGDTYDDCEDSVKFPNCNKSMCPGEIFTGADEVNTVVCCLP